MNIVTIYERLKTYPGPHPGEDWKYDKDLNHCTEREKKAIKKEGLAIKMLMDFGLNRGQVHHILFGWRFPK